MQQHVANKDVPPVQLHNDSDLFSRQVCVCVRAPWLCLCSRPGCVGHGRQSCCVRRCQTSLGMTHTWHWKCDVEYQSVVEIVFN